LMGSLLMRMRFPRHIPGALGAGAEHGKHQQMANEASHNRASLAQSPIANCRLRQFLDLARAAVGFNQVAEGMWRCSAEAASTGAR
jgi:hypothetical protein